VASAALGSCHESILIAVLPAVDQLWLPHSSKIVVFHDGEVRLKNNVNKILDRHSRRPVRHQQHRQLSSQHRRPLLIIFASALFWTLHISIDRLTVIITCIPAADYLL
jgi:hypothetical protein